jgi:23S rRNA pseudouridine1911/1915/1917 synthase
MGTIGVMKEKTQPIIFEAIYKETTPAIISSYLKKSASISGRSLRQYFFKGLVHRNHKKAHSQTEIKLGDLIQVIGVQKEYQTLKPETMPLNIIYENKDMLIINKPALLAVHPSGSINDGTLSNGIAAYFEKINLQAKVRPVNRLDYGTSGLIIFAKNTTTQASLSEAIQNHLIVRTYYAIVQGIPKDIIGTIAFPIGEAGGRRIVTPNGQPAITEYRVIEELKNASLLELTLRTGRTHQIRIHLRHIGHPILGDRQYGVLYPPIKRPALHAGKLLFPEKYSVPELSAPIPEDLNALLLLLRNG